MKQFLIVGVVLCHVLTGNAQDGEFHLDKTYSIRPDGKIDLRSTDAEVIIIGSDRQTAHVKIDRKVVMKGIYKATEDFRVDVETVDGDLIIREHQQAGMTGLIAYWREEHKIAIEAPQGVSLLIRGDDGDYFIKNINGALSITADDSDVEVTDCGGSKFNFKLDDGVLRMDGGRGELSLELDDGDAEIYGGRFSLVKADLDDGDLLLETALSDGGTYRFDMDDGDLDLRIFSGGGTFTISYDDTGISTGEAFQTLQKDDDLRKLVLPGGNANIVIDADDGSIRLSAR